MSKTAYTYKTKRLGRDASFYYGIPYKRYLIAIYSLTVCVLPAGKGVPNTG